MHAIKDTRTQWIGISEKTIMIMVKPFRLLQFEPRSYLLITLHCLKNVALNKERLKKILQRYLKCPREGKHDKNVHVLATFENQILFLNFSGLKKIE